MGSDILLQVKRRKVLGETYAQIWGFPTFLDHNFFYEFKQPREEMAHKTQEINKTYKAQKAHESVQTLKPPPHHGASIKPHRELGDTASNDALEAFPVTGLSTPVSNDVGSLSKTLTQSFRGPAMGTVIWGK